MFPEIGRTIARASTLPLVGNDVQLQSFTSSVCGDYCVLFCMALSRGVNLRDFQAYWQSLVQQPVRDWVARQLTYEYLTLVQREGNASKPLADV